MISLVNDAVRALRRHPALWAMRLAWLGLPWSVGGLISRLVAGQDNGMIWLCAVGAWIGWTVVLTGLLVRGPWALTALRVVAPGPLVIAVVGVMSETADVSALVHGTIVLIIALLPEVAGDIADGISYGDERRIMLRVPLAVAAGGLPVTWAISATGAVAGPLMLSSGRWWGVPLTAVGWLVCWQGVRAMHQLSRRWIVFVPNGFVVHDLMATREPFLLRRQDVVAIGLAENSVGADEEVIDVAEGATGAKIEAQLDGQVEVVPVRRGVAHVQVARAVRFAPTRPGLMLREARERNIPR